MPILYLIDSNILLHLIRRDTLGKWVNLHYAPLLTVPCPLISVISIGEIRSLGFQFSWGKDKIDQARFHTEYFQRISVDSEDILNAYALIDAFSERIGRSMGKNDLWIASTAHVTAAILLTTDKDFDHLNPEFINHEWIDPASGLIANGSD